MNDTTITFLNFIQSHTIQIPLIQRDYVQGLALTDKMKEKRDEFIKKLLDALLPNGKPYTLDFIYGARELYDSNAQNPDAPFLPLDGQQRLTTLFLLHWILAIKTNKEDSSNDILDLLKKFSYKTRISSDKFCRRLLASKFNKSKLLAEQIKDKTWYVSLESDPTVIAMMGMIKQIEMTLETEPYKTQLDKMAGLLFDDSEQRITFSILDMERYHLTDGLYVKMNARGKELTPFENWKADFINLLCENEEQKDRFTNSIEHEWNDLFWKDVYNDYACKIANPEENDRRKVKYPRIDENFMNFFTNFSRMYFFLEITSNAPKAEDFNGRVWSTIETLYGSSNGWVQKLFNTLDTLVTIDINEGIDGFFDNLFHINPSSEWNDQTTSVKLFDCDNVNLFNSCFKEDKFGWQHILLYAILQYCNKHCVFKVTEELKTYTRICRNYLYQHNYLDTGQVTIVPQIRVVEMKTYDKVFDYLCSERNPIDSLRKPFVGEDAKYVEFEREKICYYGCARPNVQKLVRKIEDMSYSHGYLRAFNEVLKKCVDGTLSCDRTWEAIYSFIKTDNLHKAKLFVAYNYKGMAIGNNCSYGVRVFIGGEKRWDVHFRKNDSEFGKWITDYVKAYQLTPNVDDLISEERRKIEQSPTCMRDYMLKYDFVIGAQLHSPKQINYAPFYFAMPHPWEDMDAIVIHSFSSRPLGNSFQTCPMTHAVVRSMSNYDNHHMSFSGHGSSKEGIYIHNEDKTEYYFSFYFDRVEWCVPVDSYDQLPSLLQSGLIPLTKENGSIQCYKLQVHDDDLIESAKVFMEKVVDYFKMNNVAHQ